MRFDYRGMGDSIGDPRSFEDVAPDIRAAVDTFFTKVSELVEVVIWGLCDAASVALLYAYQDARISGIVLLNPWVRTPESEAKAYLRHYYVERLVNREWWLKIWRGNYNVRGSLGSFGRNVQQALGLRDASDITQALPERMADGLERFHGHVLLILSGNDLTASEFIDTSNASDKWRRLLSSPRVTRHLLPGATHTFSRREWRDQVATWSASWVASW